MFKMSTHLILISLVLWQHYHIDIIPILAYMFWNVLDILRDDFVDLNALTWKFASDKFIHLHNSKGSISFEAFSHMWWFMA